MFLDGAHVERTKGAGEVPLVRRRFNGQQLIEKGRDPCGRRPGDDCLGQCFERVQLMRVEELRRVSGDRRSLLRLFERGGARQVLVNGMLRVGVPGSAKPAPMLPRSVCKATRLDRAVDGSPTGYSVIGFDVSGSTFIGRV